MPNPEIHDPAVEAALHTVLTALDRHATIELLSSEEAVNQGLGVILELVDNLEKLNSVLRDRFEVSLEQMVRAATHEPTPSDEQSTRRRLNLDQQSRCAGAWRDSRRRIDQILKKNVIPAHESLQARESQDASLEEGQASAPEAYPPVDEVLKITTGLLDSLKSGRATEPLPVEACEIKIERGLDVIASLIRNLKALDGAVKMSIGSELRQVARDFDRDFFDLERPTIAGLDARQSYACVRALQETPNSIYQVLTTQVIPAQRMVVGQRSTGHRRPGPRRGV